MLTSNKKVSYRKQIAHKLSCDEKFWRVDHVQIFLLSSLITMQNLVVASHTVCAHVEGPKYMGTLSPHLGMRGVADTVDT